MVDERAIQALVQRTPGDPLGPPYSQAVAGRPPVAGWTPDSFLARVIDGTAEGKSRIYKTYEQVPWELGGWWYVDEISPGTQGDFNGSRTRDAEGNWIETCVWNELGFWPIPISSIIPVFGYVQEGVHHWRSWLTPAPCIAVVSHTDSSVPLYYEWCDGAGNTFNIDVGLVRTNIPDQTNPPSLAALYPPAEVGHIVVLAPYCVPLGGGGGSAGIGWAALTPRIRIREQSPNLGDNQYARHLCFDLNDESGKPLWVLDQDTPPP